MALSANRELDRYVDQELRALPVKGSTHIRKGALVGLSGGYARGLVAGDAFAGIAYEEVDNTSATDGAVSVRVYTEGDFEHVLAGAAAASNGVRVYASDDGTLTLTAAGNSCVGRQISVPASNTIVVRIDTRPAPLSALTSALTTLTHTAPGTPDYALQDLTDSGGFGFKTKDEGNSALAVIANLQTRVGELETRLKAAGIIA